MRTPLFVLLTAVAAAQSPPPEFTAFLRVEGRPMGVIANNPHHLAGAIDSDGADKGARFMQLCDAFDIPVLSLVDCPGIMVGPDVERTALVRPCTRLFNVGANMTAPLFTVIVRKATVWAPRRCVAPAPWSGW